MSNVVVRVAPAGTKNFHPLVWQRVHIKKSLDEICHSLTLVLPVSQKKFVHKHDTIEVRVYNKYITHGDGELKGSLRVTTVEVDEVTDSTERNGKTITVLGRSPARNIIDSAWTGSADGADLLTVVTDVAKKFGITVYHIPTGQNNTETVPSFAWDCESPWTKLLNAADNQGYSITSNEAGNLYLVKTGRDASYWGFHITEGVNTKSIETTESGAEQYHEYVVVSSGVTGKAIDNQCKSNRILTMNLSDFAFDQEKANRRAQIEMYRRRKTTTKVTLTGWGLTDEQIQSFDTTYQKELFFNPNFLIPVYIPSVNLDGTMMISEVEYRAEPTAFDCTLALVSPEAYMGKKGTALANKKTGKKTRLQEIAERHGITPLNTR